MQKLTFNQNKMFFENKFSDSITEPRNIYKALKSPTLPNKAQIFKPHTPNLNNKMTFETKQTLKFFENYCSTLADNLLKKNPPSKYIINFSLQYYENLYSK